MNVPYPMLSTTCTLIAALCWSVTTVKIMRPLLELCQLMNFFITRLLHHGIYWATQYVSCYYPKPAIKRNSLCMLAP